MMTLPSNVAELVLAERKRLKLSRKALAAQLGLTEGKVHGIEHGRKIKPDEAAIIEEFISGVESNESSAESVPGDVSDSPPAPAPVPLPDDSVPIIALDEDDEDDDDEFVMVLATGESQPPVGAAESAEPDATDQEVEFRLPQADEPLAPPAEPVVIGRKVSNSEVQTYKRCKRKWWLAWYRHLVLKTEKPTGALAIGTWVHLSLAQHYVPEGQTRTDPREALERVLLDVNTNVHQYATELAENAEDGGMAAEAMLQQFKKDADLARAMIEGYVDWVEETGADEGLEVIAPEQMIAAPLRLGFEPPEPVFAVGKLDVRLRRKLDNVRMFMDHKTTASIERSTKMLHMNEQMLHYMYLEQAQYTSGQSDNTEFVGGALYNMLRKVKRTERAKPPFFQRVEVRHNNHEIASYVKHLHSTVIDMLETERKLREVPGSHQENCPPTPREDCTWSCDFYAVCPMFDDGSRVEDMLTQYFTTTEHLAYYGDTTLGSPGQ